MQCVRKGGRRGRGKYAAAGAALLPVHVEVSGATQVLALELDGVRSMSALRSLIAETYLEVAGGELVQTSMHLELEDGEGRFSSLDEGKPFRQARLSSARSLYATARPLVTASYRR